MATNRFKSDEPERRTPVILNTFQDKLAFAHHHNFDYKWGRGERWHYVENDEDNPAGKLVILNGLLAEDVWKLAAGKHIDHKDWRAARLEGLEQKCRWYLERGRMS